MKIAVIGTGYVGLVAGTCFAETGNTVVCVDTDAAKVDALKAGKIPIYEPGLEELVRRNVAEERLSFTTDTADAVQRSLVVFIAVGTPQGDDGSSDLQYVLAAARSVAKAMNGFKVIVDKSTVPVGTARLVAEAIRSETTQPFDVVSNPEFLKEGAAIDDFMKPDRVVVGCDDPRTAEIMKELYAPFVRTGKPILVMDVESAELTKYAANAMLATRISFMNEIATLCERLGANVNMVRQGMGLDSRIGMPFLFPGIGYGGSCFPKDVKALVKTSEKAGYDLKILKAVEDVNADQKRWMLRKLDAHFKGGLAGKTFGVWGLAFKPQTDDMREAPAIVVVNGLLERGATVKVCDPESMHEAKRHFGERVTYCKKAYDAIDGADALIVCTEWNEFRHPDFDRIQALLRAPVIFDGRNVYVNSRLPERGFTYYAVGMPFRAPTKS
ncbi:MAG: UDP-glucose/GDP-mannose dehydrogenase family protein [Planctomycetes bacterium]|nr:UDP-glucose/GDP-mannose dehydrogenase family protein [Planctomycetota bacterium]